MNKTHWKKMTNPDYLGAYALNPGEEKTLTISVVKHELVTGTDGKKEECIVAHFVENEKPMIMNKTNLKSIAKLYKTPYIEDWQGKKITIYIDKVKAFGEIVEALRIKNVMPKAQQPAPAVICKQCGRQIVGNGTTTAEQIIQRSLKVFGKELCLECAVAMNAQKGDQNESDE